MTIAVGSIGVVLVVLAFAIVQDSLEGALVDWFDDGTLTGVRGGGNFIGQNGVQVTSTDEAINDRVSFATSIDLVTTGADGDSTATTSPSGLEIVASELTILRGCVDNEVLLWDEATDEWACFTPESRETQFLTVRKGSPGTINVGEAVFISGFNIGQSVPEVELAENDVAASMPAIGLAFESITNSANNRIVISGRLSGAIDTSAFTAGDTIFISNTAGEVTATRPTAAGEQVQSVGLVLRSNASAGELEIVGAGRANDTPNTAFDPAITWGTGSGFTWTFDAGATDPTIAFGSGTITTDSSDLIVANNNGFIVGNPTFLTTEGITPEVQILGTGSNDSAVAIGRFSNNASGPQLNFMKGAQAIGGVAAIVDNDEAFSINATVADGNDFLAVAASISVFMDNAVGSRDTPGRLVFATTAAGAFQATTALTIDSNQDMLPTGDIDFQQAAEISTTAGDLTLNPAGLDVRFPDNTAAALGSNADSRLFYNGTDTFWNLRADGSGDLLIALASGFPSPDSDAVHIWAGSAGAFAAATTARLILEDNASVALQMAAPDGSFTRSILFGYPGAEEAGAIRYNTAGSPSAHRFEVNIENVNKLRYSAGAFAFQEDTTISTSVGGLTLSPNSTVVTSTASINPAADSTYDLGVQTTFQWANLWADLVNGADYAYVNGWRTLESEKYEGYPKGIAFANTCFADGIVTETMPADCNPVFVVTEDFVEFNGQRFYSELPALTAPTTAPGGVSDALAAMLLIGLLATLGMVVWQYHSNRATLAAVNLGRGSN